METIVVERLLDASFGLTTLWELAEKAGWCADLHRVTFVGTWFSQDARRMVCLYRAPDCEAVRQTQRVAGIPVTQLWRAAQSLDTRCLEGNGWPGLVWSSGLASPLATDGLERMNEVGRRVLALEDSSATRRLLVHRISPPGPATPFSGGPWLASFHRERPPH